MQCRHTACSSGTAKAYDQRAWWKLPRGIWSVLRVLSVWRLANGRLERSKNRGLWSGGKRQAAALEQQWLMTRAWRKLPQGIWSVLRVLSVWRLANGRLERPKNRATQWRQTWNSKGLWPEGLVEAAARDLERFKGFKRLKAGKRQAWRP